MKTSVLLLSFLVGVVSTQAFSTERIFRGASLVTTSSRDDATNLKMAPKGFGGSGGGGGGGGGFGATKPTGGRGSSSSSSSSSSKKRLSKGDMKKAQKRVLQKYGKDIAQGTQKRVNDAFQELPPHLYMATQLYQQLHQWNARKNTMSVLQQAQQLSESELEGARRAQEELDRICTEFQLTPHDLHNIFQQITWDASADAKAVRAMMGTMPTDIVSKIDRVAEIVAAAVGRTGSCLDIGCGYGVVVPHLLDSGLSPSQIHGIDLSPEMIKNAREQHPRGVHFEAVDFIQDYNNNNDNGSDEENQKQQGLLFEAVIFCSSLHDFSDWETAVRKAATLVQPRGGKLIVAHAQGASHVERQSNANPIMVKRGLPTAEELESLNLEGMTLDIRPAKAKSREEDKEGYLAVFTKA